MNTQRFHITLLILTALILCSLALLQVHDRHEIIRLGYALSDARAQQRNLKEEQTRLQLEESSLLSPEKIEKAAMSFGMTHPTPEQLQRIDCQ